MARELGIEPRFSGLEADVIPLHYSRKYIVPHLEHSLGIEPSQLALQATPHSNQARVQLWYPVRESNSHFLLRRQWSLSVERTGQTWWLKKDSNLHLTAYETAP